MADEIHFRALLQYDDYDDGWIRRHFPVERFRNICEYNHHDHSLFEFRLYFKHRFRYFQGSGRVENLANQRNVLFKWVFKIVQFKKRPAFENYQLHQYDKIKRHFEYEGEVELSDCEALFKFERAADAGNNDLNLRLCSYF